MISISKRGRAADTLTQRARLLAAVAEGDGIFKIHATHSPFTDGVHFLAAGIGLEIRKNVSKGFPLTTYWTTITTEELKREYDHILTEAGVKLLLLTTLCDVVTSGNHIEYAILTSKTGLYAVKAKIYLDCTGDGDMIALAGGKFEMGDENGDVMPPTLCSLWGDIDKSRCFDSNKDI
ncbi:MAG: FAD-dependent oxidoreductase, partial [Clostridia bacterium]|nr:FAD-dependent oxidoreductase [Clostridia bacterium]